MADQAAVLLMSHGGFAKAALESAELIIGKQDNCDTMGVYLVDQVDSLKEEMFQMVDALDTSMGLIILADITGGTPMNLASHLLSRENTILCSGLNMPMLIEVLMSRQGNMEEVEKAIQEVYREGMVIRTNKDMEREDDDDLL